MSRIRALLFATALLATIASTLHVYPHQLAYFNELAGGPENGHKHLLGSNLDWGQDGLYLLRFCESLSHNSDMHVYSASPILNSSLWQSCHRRSPSHRSVQRASADVLVYSTSLLAQPLSHKQSDISLVNSAGESMIVSAEAIETLKSLQRSAMIGKTYIVVSSPGIKPPL